MNRTVAAAVLIAGLAVPGVAAAETIGCHVDKTFTRPARITVTAAANPQRPIRVGGYVRCDGRTHRIRYTVGSHQTRPLTLPVRDAASCRVHVTATVTSPASVAMRVNETGRAYPIPKP